MKSKYSYVDAHVGSRIRIRRTLLGMSQTKLGQAVGLTFQQIQKYEKGTNRVSASRLYEFAKVLDVPVSYLFDDLPDRTEGGGATLHDNAVAFEFDTLTKRETLELVRAYHRISGASVREGLRRLVKEIAEDE